MARSTNKTSKHVPTMATMFNGNECRVCQHCTACTYDILGTNDIEIVSSVSV